jgi:molybdopterin/thiamine biosynthesis adenylyltransferase
LNWDVVFQGSEADRLRSSLLASAPVEAGALLLCNRSGERRLLVETIRIASAEDCTVAGPDRLELSPIFLARTVKAARDCGQSVILVHTHPGSRFPRFSEVDDAGEAVMIPALKGRAPSGCHGALVFGETGFQARVYPGADEEPVGRLVEVGPTVRYQEEAIARPLIDEVYDRNVRAFGEQGQRLLRTLRVGVVGLGGTGSLVAEQLGHLGVGRLLLIDHDHLAETNLNRVVGATPADVGRTKVDVASEHIQQISAGRAQVDALAGNVVVRSVGERLLSCDAVFCCTDSHGSRAVLNQLAYQHLVPVFDMGVRIDAADDRVLAMAGRSQMLAPGLACLQCQALLDPEWVRRDLLTDQARVADPYIVGAEVPQPAVISLNGVVASLSVSMFLSAFVGLPSNARRLNYRIGEGVVRSVSSEPLPGCVVCSAERGALAKGDRWPMFWREE